MMNYIIQDQLELEKVCAAAAKMPWVGLDTEFQRVRTYYPRLCLVQLATADTTICIDVLKNLDFSMFKYLLTDSNVTKIFHSARQDIEALYVAFDVSPAPLFDTQLAAQLCGYREQISYADLTGKLCSVTLSKDHTRIDWSRRPLSDSEVLYALDDARYLGPIYHGLMKQLVSLGRDSWISEDCCRLSSPEVLANGPTQAVKKIEYRARGLGQARESVAFELALWREGKAQSIDYPREWILRSDAIIAISQICPIRKDEFNTHPKLVKLDCGRWIDEILNVIELGQSRAKSYVPVKESVRPSAAERKLEKILWNKLEELCCEANIPTAAVASRRDIRKLAQGQRDLSLLMGWRGEFIGRELSELF